MSFSFRISGDREGLVELDRRGLIAAADESVEDYLARLRRLQANINRMEACLEKTGSYEIDGLSVQERARIKPSFFKDAGARCHELYGFTADWVPAFFMDPGFAFLFGGCSFCFLPDFFAMFIIRKSFRNRSRWFIYSRDELLSHEMCHIARAALDSMTYEETFAYRTSVSAFRRLFGGMFLRPADSFMLLGSTLILLLAQICRLYFFPLPMLPFWLLPLFAAGWLLLRNCMIRRRMAAAERTLAKKYGERAGVVLFRCTDEEVNALARGEIPAALSDEGTARGIVLNTYV